MSRALRVALYALLIAGCVAEPEGPPRYVGYPPPLYPPLRPLPPADSSARDARPAPSGPAAVKPIGAGVLAANAVEAYMDRQESALRGQLRGDGIVVQRSGDVLLLNIRDNLLFSSNSLSISPRGQEILGRIADIVRRFDSSLLVVNGFTDTTGTAAQNLQVSQKRADAVTRQLADDGVEQKRLAAKGFGEEILEVPTGPNVAEPRNRRVEIKISPLVKS